MAELIEPIAGAPAPVPIEPTEPQAAEAPAGPELPDEVLQIPAFQALMSGAPPATSADIKTLDKSPEGKIIAKNAEPLQASGFGFYRALDGSTGVIFNGLYLAPEQLQEADRAGQLAQIAPPFDTLNQAVATSGPINPALSAGTPPAAPPTPPAPTPPQTSSGQLPAPPASTQTSLARSRTKNLQPGSPTSGPAPGRGRLLNNLLKPAI